jgi:hypothetical protein
MHVGAWQGPASKSHLGAPILSRPGLLNLLETHLGLTGIPVSGARRAAAFLIALRAADNPQRFYHLSLQSDELGTASQLLRWRDEWMLSGWDGTGAAGWPIRLLDMVAVEAFASASVPPGEGQRLAAVLERLQVRRVPIEQVQLLDPLESFPPRWQDVLAQLPTVSPLAISQPAPGDLGRVQTACLAAASQVHVPNAPPLEDDGSVLVLRPLDVEVALHWLANHCRHAPGSARLLVAESGGASIDETFHVEGVPGCGFDEPSTLRPALQALPLALETLWAPIEPERLLEFLAHQIGPLDRRARHRLAVAFSEQPGIGGRSWTHAKEWIAERLGTGTAEAVTFWLEQARHARDPGAPVEAILERVERLQTALQSRLTGLQARGGANEAQIRDVISAASQCDQLVEGVGELQRHGVVTIRQRLLEQLVSRATADSGNSLAYARAGCLPSAVTPAACSIEPVDEVVWWMPAKPQLPSRLPWVRAELDALRGAGVKLRDPQAQMAALMGEWTRPVLVARQRLILVLPPEGSEDHPIWQLLKAMYPDLEPVALEAHAQGQMGPIEGRPLARAQGRWSLDPFAAWRASYPTPTHRETQSYSSLDLLFNNPALAVLIDGAQLEAAKTTSVQGGNKLYGNLAHRILELLFSEAGSLAWAVDQLEAWLEPTLSVLLRQEGLPLLAPGGAMRLEQFKDTIRRGTVVLLDHLRHAGAVRVEPERALKGDMKGLAVTGKTDLLVHLANGHTLAIDYKWATAPRYRERLEGNGYLQLALYALMIEQELGRAPAGVAYFTFVDAVLLTVTPDLFGPSARVVLARYTSDQVIDAAVESWNWRADQWERGEVEVIEEGLRPGPTDPPAYCLPLESLGPWHKDVVSLFGMREDE